MARQINNNDQDFQQKLAESERHYRELVELAPVGIFINLDGAITYMNNAAKGMFKVSSDEDLRGLKLSALVHPDYKKIVEKRMSALLKKSQPNPPIEQKMIALDGSILDVDVSAIPYVTQGQKAILVFVKDISEKIKNKEAIEESESLYRGMVESSPDAVVVHDGKKVIYVNDAAVKMVGAKSQAELIGRPIFDFVPPVSRGFIKKREEARNNKIMLPPIDEKMTRLDGTQLDIEVNGFPMPFHGQDAFILIIRDVSMRKKIEQATAELAASREAYHELFDYLPIGVYKNTPGPEGKFLEVNPAVIEIFEAESKEQMLGVNVRDLYQDPAQRKAFSDKLLASGQVIGEELLLKTLKGKTIWGSVSASVKKDAAGNIYFYGTFQDITERKAVEHTLKLNENKFRSLFDSSAIGIALMDEHSRLLEANQAMLQMLGYTVDELKKIQLADLTYPDDYPKDAASAKELLSGRISSYTMAKRYVRKDGAIVWGRLTASTVRDEAGKFLYALAMVENIDQQKQAEANLEQRLTELERLNKLMIGRELKMMEIKKELERLKNGQ